MAAPAQTRARTRVRARVLGTVQGVGFRPYVFGLAAELSLGGWICNDERGVLLEVEGAAHHVEELLARLAGEAPPLAVVEAVDAEPIEARGERRFAIVESLHGGESQALVSPDTATCPACLRELFDPADRRHRYPFVNCTHCGPRFTIVRDVPYDRPLTTMSAFAMCDACRAEYEDPRDRRFHAQPNACPDCGPRVWLTGPSGTAEPSSGGERDAVETAARLLRCGSILAIKGVGGFHLACRADDPAAVSALRRRKQREQKPFALMVASLEAARELVELSDDEETLLAGPERPIVLAPRRPDAAVAPAVAPRSHELGVMLAYSPLHQLLLADAGVNLVMTSGNLSEEPIAYRDRDAVERLGAIADHFLLHDRPIHVRTDDSVVRALSPKLRREPLLIRRSRGYVPRHLDLPLAASAPVLACGAELKNTFCLAKDRRAWVGHHVGDLKNYETLGSFAAGIEHFQRLFAVEPAIVAHDLHPDYLSTRYALEREGVERIAVQHHHAHLAACLAEHGETEAAVGAIFDGAGLGTDGTVWGGEILAGDLAGCERAAHLYAVRLPGGDAATREPWRMACAWLGAALGVEQPSIPAALRGEVGEREWAAASRLAGGALDSPLTTSAGRLFDGVAALCGLGARVGYEGQAATELEALCAADEGGAYPMPLIGPASGAGQTEAPFVIDARETVRAVAEDVEGGVAVDLVAARFHNALADAGAAACVRVAGERGLGRAVLSGGVFQNRRLLERAAERLRAGGLEVLIPERLPPNDGAISYGQVAVATAIAIASRG